MQQWTRIKEDEASGGLGLLLAVDAELFRLDSLVRWLDVPLAAAGVGALVAAREPAGLSRQPLEGPGWKDLAGRT